MPGARSAGERHLTATATIRNPNARPQVGSRAGAVYLPIRIHPFATAVNTVLSYSKPFWFGASTVTAVMIVFGTVNYGTKPRPQPALQQQASLAPIFSTAKETIKETVVYRAPDRRQSFQDRWEQARVFFSEAETEATDDERLDQTGSVQTVRAKNPIAQVAAAEDKIGALAFAPPTTPATFSLASATSEPVGRLTTGSLHEAATSPEARALSGLDEVERYLWEVYQRAPVKKDGSGDFTWKDPVAAKRFGKSMPAYVIGGMDPDFKEQLYHAGKAMDAAGVQWAILSAFRDDYRQSLASGFKASAAQFAARRQRTRRRLRSWPRGRCHRPRRQSRAGLEMARCARRQVRTSPSDARQRSGPCPIDAATGAGLRRRCGRAARRSPRHGRLRPRVRSPPPRRAESHAPTGCRSCGPASGVGPSLTR